LKFKSKKRFEIQFLGKISDVKKCHPDFPLAIVTLPPNPNNSAYKRLEKNYNDIRSMYSDLGADILTEDNIEPWVKDHFTPIPA